MYSSSLDFDNFRIGVRDSGAYNYVFQTTQKPKLWKMVLQINIKFKLLNV